MKRATILIVTILLIAAVVRSQNYDQVLVDLIQDNKMFEADRYYSQYKDSLHSDFVKQFYKAEVGAVFNRYDESIEASEQLGNTIFKNVSKFDLDFNNMFLVLYRTVNKMFTIVKYGKVEQLLIVSILQRKGFV